MDDIVSFALDLSYLVLIVLLLGVAVLMFALGHVFPAVVSLVAVVPGIGCIRYRLRVAHYYLGKPRP